MALALNIQEALLLCRDAMGPQSVLCLNIFILFIVFQDIKPGMEMREIRDSRAQSYYIGELPEGCKLCIRGKKSVLFATGECKNACYYCPISTERKGKKRAWINERPIEKWEDIVEEIRACGSRGVGITGGDPVLELERVCEWIRRLKKEFGKGFHVHLYTSATSISPEVVEKLEEAGLDELRIHVHHKDQLGLIRPALGRRFVLGIENPSIPTREGLELLVECGLWLEENGGTFLNINELEFSETNAEQMKARGFATRPDALYEVAGSHETAIRALEILREKTSRISVHYCTAATKYEHQYWKRIKNRAMNVKKPWEKLLGNGLIEKGVIYPREGEQPEEAAKRLGIRHYSIERERIETSVAEARKSARKGEKTAIVHAIACWDPYDFEVTPLDSRGRKIE